MPTISSSELLPANLRHLIYGLHPLLTVMKEHGISYDDILKDFDVSESTLINPASLITPKQELGIISACLSRINKPGVGLEIGSHFHLSSYGLLGLAAMSCTDLQRCFEMLFKYIAMTWTYFRFSFITEDDKILLAMEPLRDLGSSYQFMLDRDICATLRNANEALGFPLPLIELRLKQKTSSYQKAYQDIFDCPISFGASSNAIVFDKKWLTTTLVKSDENTARTFSVECEKINKAITQIQSVSENIRQLISHHKDLSSVNIEQIASELNVTPRTLQRKLAREGVSYKTLFEEVRKNTAIEYLLSNELSIEKISDLLGYGEVSNFSHAFKRWIGSSPSEYRKLNHTTH